MKFKCDNGHLVDVPTQNEKKTLRKAEKMLIVCPECKPNNVPLHHIEDSKYAGKQFVCSKKHLTEIYPFTNGFCSVTSLDYQENIEADPELMQEMIDDGFFKCQCTVIGKNGRSRACNCKLVAVDNEPLDVPNIHGLKTKTRVGDVWDKAGCPEPKESSARVERRDGKDYDAHLEDTEFSRRNRKRVADMRRKTNQRNAEARGEVMKKPTKNRYRDGSARRPSKKDLKGRD